VSLKTNRRCGRNVYRSTIRNLRRLAAAATFFAAMLVAILSMPATSAVAQAPSRPNVLFVLVDDLGWADIGCYGADLHKTPNIDRFAAGALRMTDAYAAAPVCTPTRASIMTGKAPARLHMTIWFEASGSPPRNRPLIPPVTVGNLPHEEVTLAERFHAAGYHTVHLGKWHLGDAAHYPETQGFDDNIGGTFWGAPFTFFWPYRGSKPGRWGGEFRYVPHLEGGHDGEYLTDRLTDEALKVINADDDRPFFLYLAFHTVHTPIEGKPELVARYRRQLAPSLHHQNATYAAMVHSLDENVGRLLAALDERKLADDTIVVFTSDNGGFVNPYEGETVTNNHPLRSGKGSLYEGGIRVPMAIRWPGVTSPGATCSEPVLSTDLHPTLVEMAGLEPSISPTDGLDGMSLVPLLENPTATFDREALYFHYPHYYATTTPASAVRTRDWKLIEYQEDGHLELYNLADDLSETNDLAGSMPDRAARLRGQLDSWRTEVDAQMATPNRGVSGR